MNIQTIQIMILLLDGIIKLAPWRVVMEVMGRIGYRSRQNPVRGLRLAVSAITGLGAAAMVSDPRPRFLCRLVARISRWPCLRLYRVRILCRPDAVDWIMVARLQRGPLLLARTAWKFSTPHSRQKS